MGVTDEGSGRGASTRRADRDMNKSQAQMRTADAARAGGEGRDWSDAVLRWSGRVLVAATWVSGAIFAIYILAFFGGVALRGAAERWNESLPGLHDAAAPAATIAIGVHFLAGGVLLLLGPIQLIGGLRRRLPALHRWLGRTYVISAILAGVGGLGFILFAGTIGGTLMDVGFGGYGVLMVLCAVLAWRHARAGRYDRHRAWAIRLFALTVGSWLYRMEYAAWSVLAGDLGRGAGFTGWFDAIMMFFFYVPNLLVAEVFIRVRRSRPRPVLRLAAAALLLAATALVVLATWLFTRGVWVPRAISGLVGGPA